MTRYTPASEFIPAIIGQHAEEAAFLCTFREGLLMAPHYLLQDLANLDNRIEAHLDGLRVAGGEGWKICEEQLANGPGEVFTAGVQAFESADMALVTKVMTAVEQEPKLADAFVSAFGWSEFQRVERHIHALLRSNNPVHQFVGIGAATIHRQNPGVALARAVMSDEPVLKARALKAVGELGRTDLVPEVRRALNSEHPAVRFVAAWTAGLLAGDAAAVSVLQSFAETPGPYQEKALQLLVGRLDPGVAKTWQKQLSRNPGSVRLSLTAAGVIADPEFIPWLIGQMKVAASARLAGEAFVAITGVDMARDGLEGKRPEGFETGPTEDPNDENVEMDPDEHLPWPNPELVQKWWDKNRGQFQNGTRYVCGKPMTIDWLKVVLRDGYQRQRAAAALELAIRQPGTALFNVKAPGFRQIQLLGKPRPAIR
jgi:uncharacterized protein (TIGR02270 family)